MRQKLLRLHVRAARVSRTLRFDTVYRHILADVVPSRGDL